MKATEENLLRYLRKSPQFVFPVFLFATANGARHVA